ncbi:Trp biosynthesis-associated membrane protein [Nesterenkonia alba]|uniref:Trp biosynthesis-associated membrane protein n=1 Tax=Nesterenkonia alba TaxID=515814 RepID=UPI0003B640CA|nr:Trp biosynthesis-associated membrane protein [Nesterenkonia alba]
MTSTDPDDAGTTTPHSGTSSRPRLSRRIVVLLGLAAGGMLFLSATQTWVTAEGLPETAAAEAVDIAGTEVSDTVTAMALVGLAGGAALSIARRVARIVIGALILAAGALAAVTVIRVLLDPAAQTLTALGEITGTTEPAAGYEVQWALGTAAAGAVLLIAAGILTLVAGRRWPDAGASKKYARRTHGAGTTGAEHAPDEFDLWDDLSAGEDPTEDRTP